MLPGSTALPSLKLLALVLPIAEAISAIDSALSAATAAATAQLPLRQRTQQVGWAQRRAPLYEGAVAEGPQGVWLRLVHQPPNIVLAKHLHGQSTHSTQHAHTALAQAVHTRNAWHGAT